MRYTLIAFLIIIIVLPLIPLFLYAFSSAIQMMAPTLWPSKLSFDTIKYTWDLFGLEKVMWDSIKLSLTVMILAVVLGFFPAKVLGTMDFKGKRFMEIFSILPSLTPGIAVIFGLICVVAPLGLYKTYLGLVLAELTFILPYVIITMTSVFRNYDMDNEYQGSTIGMNPLSVFLHITLPNVKSGIAVSCMYAFEISWSIYLLASVLAPNDMNTMATVLFLQINGLYGYDVVAALAVSFFVPALFMLIVTTLIMGSDKNTEVRGNL